MSKSRGDDRAGDIVSDQRYAQPCTMREMRRFSLALATYGGEKRDGFAKMKGGMEKGGHNTACGSP